MTNTTQTPWSKGLLNAGIVITTAALAVSIVIAVMIDVQSGYLANRSESTGGFDPTVFPPFNEALWVIGNLFPWLISLALALLSVARVAVARRA